MKKNTFLHFSLNNKLFYKVYLYYNLYIRNFKYLFKESYSQVDEDIFSLQVNMFPSLIPYKINSISKIENKFNKLNYNLIYKSKRSCGKHKHLNKNQLFSRDLIFKRS